MNDADNIFEKIIARHKEKLKSDLEEPNISIEKKQRIAHEIKGMKKFGIDAIGSANVFI